MMERLNSMIAGWRKAYHQQGQIGKIILAGGSLFVLCCLCSFPLFLFRSGSRDSSNVFPSPPVLPSAGIQATPTALFNFGTVTFAPFPTFPTSTALPTVTNNPTETPTLTPTQTPTSLPTETMTSTSIPTVTNPPATETSATPVVMIIAVNKPKEYVDIQNLGTVPVNLSGWKLVSETGNQSCALSGDLQPNEVLRIWARRGNPGFSCRFSIYVWKDNQPDPAVLYNPQGQEVSRYP